MKKNKTFVLGLTSAALLLGASLGQVQAQNTNYIQGDLVVFFQNPGGLVGSTNQVFASLGNTALTFRDATPGAAISLLNINSQLTTAFGSNWADATTLYGGAGGVWGNAGSLSSTLQNGDPNRTVYTSYRRASVGTVGAQNSVGYSISSDTAMTGIANSMIGQNNILEVNSSDQAAVIPVATAPAPSIPLNNPVGGNGWNNIIPGDVVMQGGQAGNFGTFGTFTDVEFMWDIYRIQAKNNINGQYGQGDPLRQGEFLGTMTLSSNGDVGFTAVPEPSTYALLALAAAGLGAHVIRRRKMQS